MKRAGNLFPAIADPDNLRLAFWKATKGKKGKVEVEQFRGNLDAELLCLREELLDGTVRMGNYHYFKIYDPKERTICAASFRERVLHHAIMNVCHPVFERFQLSCSFATRPGKGTYAALDLAKRFNTRHRWFLKLDVRQYFASISHDKLLALLERKFKDKRLLQLFASIIASYSTASGRGLPIGNLTSQYFANYYLAFTDHLVKEELGVGAYVRYLDDMVLWSDSKEQLKAILLKVERFLGEELRLALKICQLNRCSAGLTFLGYRLKNGKVLLAQRSKRRFLAKMRAYHAALETGEWTQAEFQAYVLPLLAYAIKAETFGLRKSVLKRIADQGRGHQPRYPWRQLEQQPQ